MKKKKLFGAAIAMAVAAAMFVTSYADEVPVTTALPDVLGDNLIVYTTDTHCAVTSGVGLANVAAIKADLIASGKNAVLVDSGDAIQGGTLGTLTQGEAIVDIMNAAAYDYSAVGNHEFDYGKDELMKLSEKAEYKYLASNVKDADKKNYFSSYELKDMGGVKVAFVGVATPETALSSDPANFLDESGTRVVFFCGENNREEFYADIQASIDAATAEGASIVVLLTHLGIAGDAKSWIAPDLIAATTGVDAVIDGHAHITTESAEFPNKDGENVLLTSTGTKLTDVGVMSINADGTLTPYLLESYEPVTDAGKAAADKVTAEIETVNAEFEEILGEVVAKTEFDLTINDVETGDRRVRMGETNLGDLCADAFQAVTGADIAIVNGGGVRANIPAGDITYKNLIDVMPFGDTIYTIEISGQKLLDALELSAAGYPEEFGGFLQVSSGFTYYIDSTIPTSVTLSSEGSFTGVEGARRITYAALDGEKLDPEKTYTLAADDYLLNGGNGYSMFVGCPHVGAEINTDVDMLIDYICDRLDGVVGEEYSVPTGEGRILFNVAAPVEEEAAEEETAEEETAEEEAAEEETAEETEEEAEEVDASEEASEETSAETAEETEVADTDAQNDNPKTGVTISFAAVIALAVMAAAKKKAK